MRVLVLGGTRFMGPFAVRRLVESGHDVTVFHRGRSQADLPPAVRHITGDRQRLADFRGELCAPAPEVVLDMLPMTEADARAVQETFRGVAGRLVAISSQDVYRAYGRLIGTEPGSPDPVPLDEDAPLREKLYPYRGAEPRTADDPAVWMDDYDKIPMERLVLGTPDLPGTVLRLPAVYGPGDRQHRTWSYLKRADDGRPAILLGASLAGWRWTRGYVENVADAIALAVLDPRAAGRVYNVGEEQAPTEAEWARAIVEAVGWRGRIVTVPDERLPASLAVKLDVAQPFVSESSRIRRELGYSERVPRDEAMRRTVAWERAHPPEQVDPAAYDYAAEDVVLAALDQDPPPRT
jgi:nucleoside-diphosphate-sugar epimerase